MSTNNFTDPSKISSNNENKNTLNPNLNGIIQNETKKKIQNTISANVSENLMNKALENENKRLGLLGKIFGIHDHTDIHITGFIALILVISGIIYRHFQSNSEDVKVFWGIITPIVTSCLGYIFGKNSTK